jgi:hypothetical protein
MGLCRLLDSQDAKERKDMTTLREEVEAELGLTAKPARIGKRYHAAPAWAPSHWRKTLKVWAGFALGLVVGGMAAGIVVGLAGRVWP